MNIDLMNSTPSLRLRLVQLGCVALLATTLACASGQTTEGEGEGPTDGGTAEEGTDRGTTATGPGCVLGDCENGTGTYIYENGDKYVGTFKDGLRDGKGTFEYTNGDKFVGGYAGGKRQGEGTYIFKNGDKYVGMFENGLRSGKGVYTFNQGGVFRGQFIEDGNKGEGTLVQGETPFDCDLRSRGLFCEAAPEGKVIKEAVDDSNLTGEDQ